MIKPKRSMIAQNAAQQHALGVFGGEDVIEVGDGVNYASSDGEQNDGDDQSPAAREKRDGADDEQFNDLDEPARRRDGAGANKVNSQRIQILNQPGARSAATGSAATQPAQPLPA